MKRWETKDTLWLIAVIALAMVLLITVLFGRNVDAISIISIFAGIVSIVLAIYAIIQSFIYDRRSSLTYHKMEDKLSSIDTKQDRLYNIIDGMKSSIDSDPELSQTTKSVIKESLDRVSDEYYSGSGNTIQHIERASVEKEVNNTLAENIIKRNGKLCSPRYGFINLEAISHNTRLYFTYSIRNSISGENWPEQNVSAFFSDRIETYISHKHQLKGIWIYFIVFSDSVYYYITNSETTRHIQKDLHLGANNVLVNKEWIDLIMNDIDNFII